MNYQYFSYLCINLTKGHVPMPVIPTAINKLKYIFLTLLVVTFAIFSSSLLLRIDAIQQRLGDYATAIIRSNDIPLGIGSVEVKLFNKIEIKDILLNDLNNDTLASIDKITLNLSPLKLFKGEIRINTATIAHPYINIYRDSASVPTNAQFLLDILAGDDSSDDSEIPQIGVGQLRIYDGEIRYRDLSAAGKGNGIFDSNNIGLYDIEAKIAANILSKEHINIHIKQLRGKEKSGAELSNLFTRIEIAKHTITLHKSGIALPRSLIEAPQITLHLPDKYIKGSKLRFEGEISSEKIDFSDFTVFSPALSKLNNTLQFRIPFNGTPDNINLPGMEFATNNNSIFLEGSLYATKKGDSSTLEIELNNSAISEEGAKAIYLLASGNDKSPEILDNLGEVCTTGKAILTNGILNGVIAINSECGEIKADIRPSITGGYNGSIKGSGIKLGTIANNDKFDKCDIDIRYVCTYTDSTNYNGQFNSVISSFDYNRYTYAPISISGKITPKIITTQITSNDKNLAAELSFGLRKEYRNNKYNLSLNVDSINPHNLNLTERLKNSTISFNLETSLSDKENENTTIAANMYNFRLHTPRQHWEVRHMHIADNTFEEKRNLIINSDILNGHITGYYNYNTLVNSFTNIIKEHLPTLAGEPSEHSGNNNFVFGITLKDSELFSTLFDLPINIASSSSISGSCDDKNKRFEIVADLNDTEFSGRNYKNIALNTTADNEGLILSSIMKRPLTDDNNEKAVENDLTIEMLCSAANDTLYNNFLWNSSAKPVNKGYIHLDISFSHTTEEEMYVNAMLRPGSIIYNDSLWTLQPAQISGGNNRYIIDNLSLHGNNRFLNINGVLGNEEEDELKVALHNIVLEDLFNLLNFHSVEFGGVATGNINANSLLEAPQVDASLDVEGFKFEGGYMGNLGFKGNWDKDNKAIVIHGEIDDESNTTLINGIVSPANDTINLEIEANGTRAEFLEHMIGDIVNNVESRAYGDIAVRGKLSDINLYGKLAPKGSMRVCVTNTTYDLIGDTISFTRNRIGFKDVRIFDRNGNGGVLNGAVNHNSLSDFTCSFDIAANNLLAYNSSSFGDDGFYGTAYVTGNANLVADDEGIRLRAEIETESNSKFVYNAAGPMGNTSNEFVTFTDSSNSRKKEKSIEETPVVNNENSILSRLNLDFLISVTPDLQLRVYTNTITNDYIDLYGNGQVNAIYDEKEGFSMKGNLDLSRGTYKFTMQDIFPKEFAIRSGTLNFNGDPFLANLNLNTLYTVPSASLTDLNPTAERRKSVKVNCLMDITGTLQNPNLTFGLELPDGNEEERELLASATSTPEQTNMQFIYLVGIGKFYTYEYYNQQSESQSSTMMESLISSTISGQLNNMLSQIVDSNWNLSGNFASSEKGWSSMEVEGMLSGRLLDNRLLINGYFVYRDDPMINKNFIGDFEVQWLLNKNGNVSLKAYSKTNDRYFSKTTLTTQGAGLLLRHDFNSWMFWRRKEDNKQKK